MSICVKLFATLRENRDKKLEFDFKKGITSQEIILKLNIELNEVAILLVNGIYSPPEQELEDGDVVSLFPPVGGG
ncbi:MAG: MoaD/ThiS family protein [Candidatus Cloacimonadota bacterium]|nr:MoaD/ThiS family protein [Candidatus Cloacimonadota bacterium]